MNETIKLNDLFESDKKFEIELKKVTNYAKKIKTYKGIITNNADMLLEFLEYDVELSKRLERLYLYAHINNDLDLTNQMYQEYLGKVLNLANQISEESSFVIPEIIKVPYSKILEFEKKNSKLKEFHLELKNIYRQKKLIKSEEEEKLISILTSGYDKPEDTSELLLTTDIDYGYITDENNQKIKLTLSNFSTYLESSNQSIRKEAFSKIYEQIKKHENTFNSILTTKIIEDNRIAKIRGFSSAKDLSLYSNNIDKSIYDSLIKGIHQNLNKFYKYYDFKKKVLNLKEFHLYDTYANITTNYDKKYSYEQAKNIVLDSLKVMGKEYVDVIQKAFADNWISAFPKPNKRDGGYCTASYLAHPYVVINYEKNLNDVSTLTHELGHAMHYYYAIENNSYQNYNYSIFVAEVASQVNEIILTNYLLNKSDNIEEKKYLLDSILNRFKATMIRQTMFAEFEDKIHNLEYSGTILTKDVVQSLYYDLNKLYFGNNVYVDEEIKYECYRIPHFYYNFYVYQYATGYAAALKIAHDIILGTPKALDNYLKFLKLGSTKSPVESLRVAGIDIKDSKIYDEIFVYFDKYLQDLRSLYE